MTKTALVIITDGSEEMEATIVIDVLRRGGVDVTVAGLTSAGAVTCARKTRILPDVALSDVKDKTFDVVVLPGGQPASNTFAASEAVGQVLRAQYAANRLVAAICAAPLALKGHNVAVGSTITSYPGVKDELVAAGFKYAEDPVVVSGNVVTSRGPGTSFLFALQLVEILVSAAKANEVAAGTLVAR